jgi:RNA polymerase sigma-70 factor (ECF subfamily)
MLELANLVHRFRSDEALMLAYQHGDASAFECLYRRHKDSLYTFLYRSCPRPGIVEDVAQEAWEAVINAASRYEASAKFRTWLFQIGRRRLADYWRRKDNQLENMDQVPEPPANGDEEPYSDLQHQILLAIAELPGEQRDALLLQEQGFTVSEIADITGSGEETIKSRLRYARKQLKEKLGERLGDTL